MNLKLTLGLLFLAVAIGALVYFAPEPGTRSAAPQADKATTPDTTQNVFEPQIKVDAVTRVELEQQGKPKLVFERTQTAADGSTGQTEYRMVEPVATAAEGFVVRGLISSIANLQTRERFTPGDAGQPSAADAGFEPPTAIARLTDETGATHVLEVGRKVVMSESTYVRRAGEKEILVATTDILPTVRKDVDDYRAKRLLDFRLEEAVGLTVVQDGTTVQLSKNEAGEWVIESPVRAAADREKVRAFLTKLSASRLDTFVADDPAGLGMYGLDQPALRVGVAPERTKRAATSETQPAEPEKTRTTHTLLVGGPAGLDGKKRYVKLGDAPWVGDVLQTTVDTFAPNLKELRDPRVLRISGATASRIEIASGGQTAVVEKADGAWKGVTGVSEVDQNAVAELVTALESLRAVDYVDDAADPRLATAPFGLATPRATITITAAGVVEPVTLRVGGTTGTGRNAYLQRGDEPTVIVTTEAQAEKLAIGTLALRSKQIVNLTTDAVQRIEVTHDQLTAVIERAESGWQLAQPAGAPLNAPAAGAMATNLARLRAAKLVDAATAEKLPFASPAASIRFTAKVDEKPANEQAGPPTQATREFQLRLVRHENVAYGRLGDEASAFELDDSVYRTLTAELLEPTLLSVDPNSIMRVDIVSERGTLGFARKDAGWTFTPDPTVSVAPEKAKALVDAVAGLKADSYLAWSGADLAAMKLADAPASIMLTTTDGQTIALKFRVEDGATCPRLGALVTDGRVFRLSETDCEAIFMSLDDLLKPEAPPARPGMPQGMPPQGMPGMP